VFFIAHFIYFAVFNRYHLAYHEQIQLFHFDWNYFTSFLTKPGGLTKYFGAFFIQFYIYPIIGAFIVTLAGIATYALTGFIFRKYKTFGILWSIIPVLLLIALQSDPYFTLVYSLGLLFALAFIALYISISNDYLRYTTGFTGWFFLYLATGGVSLLSIILCIIHELFFAKNRYRFFIALGYILIAVLLPYIAWKYIYYIPITSAWLSLIVFPGSVPTTYGLLLLLAYFPSLLILMKIWLALSKKIKIIFGWNFKTFIIGIAAGIIVILAFPGCKKLYAYNRKIEYILRIDNSVQHEQWDRVLKLSSAYKKTDPFIVFFTNLALCKSGKLGDRMFYYNQIGPSGLCLDWEEDNITPFFGSEIFYHLGYFNEAYRWAFEAMVSIGQSPHLLKRLVLISLINGNYAIAEKYLNVLDQTLFYRKWAQHYLDYLHDPGLLLKDQEITEKRHLLIHTDFFADLDSFDFNCSKLLENHPDNRTAFEYFMASLLLKKNITAFVANIDRLKDYGYREIPVHYEEALLVYMVNANKNIVPKGYVIRESTTQRFKDYLNIYSPYFGKPRLEAARALSKLYGNTYWFYSQFY